jgi:hypothetical protein
VLEAIVYDDGQRGRRAVAASTMRRWRLMPARGERLVLLYR